MHGTRRQQNGELRWRAAEDGGDHYEDSGREDWRERADDE